METDIDTIAVLGAGNMGHGIAEVAALAGFDVRMRDIDEELVSEGYDNIEWSLDKLAEKDQITHEEADAALDRVEAVVDLEAAAADADLVIEAVPEKMEVKKEVYRELEAVAPPEAIFATNTSSLSVTVLSEATDRPERFCGMHFFNPPVRMQLVEVIAGAHTDSDVLDTAEELATAMGKTPVRVRKDSPGFIVNRVLIPMLNEAAWLVHDGEATVEAVDASAKYDMGLPMGAFELTDQVGVDVALDVLEYVHGELGAAYEPCPLLREKVDAGELGRKTDRGFYDYDDGGAEVDAGAGSEGLVELLTAVMANEVAKLVADDVADVDAIDNAMQLGAGFPDGPGRMADDYGLDALHERLLERHDETGAQRYEPAEELAAMASEGRTFYGDDDGDGGDDGPAFETLQVEIEGDLGHVVLDREHRMNTVTTAMLEELVTAVDHLESADAVRAILLTGAGERAFSAGADVNDIVGSANPLDAVELSRQGQRAFGRLEETDLVVVAGIDGYCLGGGMELATAADLRVASVGSEFGQVEHNLGIMPGWGGTQRLPDVVGETRAKEIIFTAERYDAETMADYGFLTEVVDGDAESAARDLAADVAAGPPIAQAYTKRAIHAGREDRDAGLEVEAASFGQLLNTEDFSEGVTAFASDRDPEFTGE
jgi:enoyl-CoA hydratase/3-hydroxyacyl-CoA dehydrogenase